MSEINIPKLVFRAVVLCEDCQYATTITEPICGTKTLFCEYGTKPVATEPTHFCGYGERKEQE